MPTFEVRVPVGANQIWLRSQIRAAVAEAQASLRSAFEIRQRLDDAEPEDPATREAMLGQIVELSRIAQAAPCLRDQSPGALLYSAGRRADGHAGAERDSITLSL